MATTPPPFVSLLPPATAALLVTGRVAAQSTLRTRIAVARCALPRTAATTPARVGRRLPRTRSDPLLIAAAGDQPALRSVIA